MDENQPLRQLAVPSVDPSVRQWIVSRTEGGRLDRFLVAHVQDITRREILERIAVGHARINGHIRPKSATVHPGDTVVFTSPPPLLPNPHLAIPILWADDAIVVINKPSGIPSVALRSDETDTVANFLLAQFPDSATASPHPLEAGVVHRLDTATSGVLLAARTTRAYKALREQFTSRTVEKHYLALVHGQVQHAGERRSYLRPSGPRGRRMQETTTGDGQEAWSMYTPVTHFPHHTLIRVTIPTGVRHQIRVHLATLGHPIVGDTVYGAAKGGERLCLHAESLTFLHPQTRVRVHISCPLPEDFQVAQRQIATDPQ